MPRTKLNKETKQQEELTPEEKLANPVPTPPEGEPYVLTEEYLQNNPQLEADGFKVGDTVYLPKIEEQAPVEEVPPLEPVAPETPEAFTPPVEEVLPTTPVEPEVVTEPTSEVSLENSSEPQVTVVSEPTVEAPQVLGKPGWLDEGVWKSLTDEQKVRICNGESLASVK